MVNFGALMELRRAMERGEMIYRVGIETLTREQVERRVALCVGHGNETEASRLHAMLKYPVEGIGVGHGFFCECATCIEARAREWRSAREVYA